MFLATSYVGIPTLFGFLCFISVIPAARGLFKCRFGRQPTSAGFVLGAITVLTGSILGLFSFPPSSDQVPVFYIGPIAAIVIGVVTCALSRYR